MKLLVFIAVLLFSGLSFAQESVLMSMGYWLEAGDATIEQATQAKYTATTQKFSLSSAELVAWVKFA